MLMLIACCYVNDVCISWRGYDEPLKRLMRKLNDVCELNFTLDCLSDQRVSFFLLYKNEKGELELAISHKLDESSYFCINLFDVMKKLQDDFNRIRFEQELEFVQCLGNPGYINYLAHHGLLRDKRFINYFKYLLYWTRPEYVKYIHYPVALDVLRLLQNPEFREATSNPNVTALIDEQIYRQWTSMFQKMSGILKE
ncbi:hypothetical protein GJ496_002929 [Pomphorhynchus laevis]|nr:hypothetical protein GJ496_002929 [Pomphorhynchus laevis]